MKDNGQSWEESFSTFLNALLSPVFLLGLIPLKFSVNVVLNNQAFNFELQLMSLVMRKMILLSENSTVEPQNVRDELSDGIESGP